jgi:hypothetical protein
MRHYDQKGNCNSRSKGISHRRSTCGKRKVVLPQRRQDFLVFFGILVLFAVVWNLWYSIAEVHHNSNRSSSSNILDDITSTQVKATPTGGSRTSTSSSVRNHSALLDFEDYNYIRNDVYAAAWWQSVDRFTNVMDWITKTDDATRARQLIKLEAACHLAVEYQPTDVRLTRNWLDFGVEHLSKWWKLTRYQKHATAFYTLCHRLVQYLVARRPYYLRANVKTMAADTDGDATGSRNPWCGTLAVVAYSPLIGPRAPNRAQVLDILVTSATLMSLVRQGCRRIILIVDQSDEIILQQQIWPSVVTMLRMSEEPPSINGIQHYQGLKELKLLLEHILSSSSVSPLHNNSDTATSQLLLHIYDTDILPLMVDSRTRDPRGKWQKRVPRQALLTVYDALRKQSSSPPSSWLWDSKPFRYIYYTEQDSILYSSFETHNLALFQQNLDEGKLLIPHRWQPIPHETDFTWLLGDQDNDLPQTFFVPDIPPWDQVDALGVNNSHASYCCDAGLNDSTTNFSPKTSSPCSDFWYMCGLGRHAKETYTVHQRLTHLFDFSFIRLLHGTGLTLLAASEHARKCQPSKHPCY